jgi:rRNA processing protein Gar1
VLRPLGKVVHTVPSGHIVVELSGVRIPSRLELPVYDSEARRVGTLLDVIGPTSRPYAVVKPGTPGLRLDPGTDLYYREPRDRRRPARGGRGRRKRGRGGPRQEGRRRRGGGGSRSRGRNGRR